MMFFQTIPVSSDDNVLLFDMYVNGHWIGSRRTLRPCALIFRGYC